MIPVDAGVTGEVFNDVFSFTDTTGTNLAPAGKAMQTDKLEILLGEGRHKTKTSLCLNFGKIIRQQPFKSC